MSAIMPPLAAMISAAAPQREAHGHGGHVRVGVAERLEAGEALGVAGAGQVAGQRPLAGPAGHQAARARDGRGRRRPTRPGRRTARPAATAIPGRCSRCQAIGSCRQFPPAASAPLAIQRCCQVSPGWPDSQSRNQVRARLRRSWLSALARTNIPLVSRSKASPRSCLVAGQSVAAGRGGNRCPGRLAPGLGRACRDPRERDGVPGHDVRPPNSTSIVSGR